MRVVVVGAGLMGAQIGCEYALGGHDVTLVARNAHAALERGERGLALVRDLGLAPEQTVAAAHERLSVCPDLEAVVECDLAVESVPENLGLKAELLRQVVEASPDAIIASNTSSLLIGELGREIGAPQRTIGTHYWNPPLLMPLVEVIAGERTDPSVVDTVCSLLRTLRKRPVLVERDVPGFVWNRLQMAVLREAVWIVENGVAAPDTVDEILTYGLGRRWRNVGFFRAIALGGVDTWERTAANLFPVLSAATELDELGRWLESGTGANEETAARRDRGLARDLLDDRAEDG
jgi:3-hydroxybutyryl-CoA dehydrogenase